VLVTDGDARAALAVTRSLGRLGHEVIVGGRTTPSLAQVSRYCAAPVVYPDPVVASEDFLDALARIVHERTIDALIPIADITTFLVTRHRARFGPACAVPFAPADTIERAADKIGILRLAERLGVPVPRTVVVSGAGDVPASLMYPVVIKPRQSRVRTPQGWKSSSVSHADSRDELMKDLRARPAHEFPVMLQARVVGPGVGVFACYHEGKPVALFSHRRLREKPPWGGVSVLCESVPLPVAATEYATRLLDALEWHGVAMVEFKHDVADDLPKLMEINGRFWGSLQLAVDSGVDFPAILLQTVAPGSFGPLPTYRTGVRSRWFWGDVDSLMMSLVRGRGPYGAPARSLRTVAQFLNLWGRDLYYDNPKWDDREPWFFECRHRFVAAVEALRRRVAHRRRESPPMESPRRSGHQ
jgi:predicted ATP-grasp superfamily ATP-dependent carboligase